MRAHKSPAAYVRNRTKSLALEGSASYNSNRCIWNCEALRESACAGRQRAYRQGIGRLHRWFSGSDEEGRQMKSKFESYSRLVTWFIALSLIALVAGCGGSGSGGRDPILGTG